MLGGFGNLIGEMEFWDLYKKKRLGVAQDPHGAKSFQWTPDGRRFITASLRPWRRVDNGYKVGGPISCWRFGRVLNLVEKGLELCRRTR